MTAGRSAITIDARGRRRTTSGDPAPRGDWQDLTAELGQVAAPALFMWGREDGFLTPDYPLMLSRMVPHGNLYVMDHTSHHLQEERPAAYHAIVDGFLNFVDHP